MVWYLIRDPFKKICVYAVLFSLAYFVRFVNLMWEEVLRNLSRQHAVLCIISFMLFFRQVKLDCSIQLSLVVSIAYATLTACFECSVDREGSFVFIMHTQRYYKALQKAFFFFFAEE